MMQASAEDLVKKLRALQAQLAMEEEASGSKDAEEQGFQHFRILPPKGTQRATAVNDPVQEKINAYMRKDFKLPEIPEEYANLPAITADMRPVRKEFPDNALKDAAGIRLVRCLEGDIINLGRMAIPMIANGFSKWGAATILILAYHLKVPRRDFNGDEYVFGVDRTLEHIADKKYTDYPTKVMAPTGRSELLAGGGDPEKEATIYAYLAASMLRLFTKSPANYVKAWTHIVEGFSKFYGKPIDIRLPRPNETVVKGLADWFSFDPKAKVTLYRLLYLGNENDHYNGLKRFLYDIHVSYTGMHIVNILIELCQVKNCTPGIILNLLQCQEMQRQIDCLTILLGLLQDKTDTYKRRMWRYGRLFDETFMADLQTKTCPKFVYLLASALKMQSPKIHGGILGIAQLSDVSEENKKKCTACAAELLQRINRANKEESQGECSGMAARSYTGDSSGWDPRDSEMIIYQ